MSVESGVPFFVAYLVDICDIINICKTILCHNLSSKGDKKLDINRFYSDYLHEFFQ